MVRCDMDFDMDYGLTPYTPQNIKNMNFIDITKENGFKVPLSMKMLKYYTDLGFPCWCIGTIGSNVFIKFIFVFDPNAKVLDFKDLRYIASLDCNPRIPFSKIDKYLCKKYGQL